MSLDIELFSLHRLLSVKTLADQTTTVDGVRTVRTLAPALQCATFNVVASSGAPLGGRYLAAVTSNDHLLLRYSSPNSLAYVRIVPWWKDRTRKIVALDFSPSGEWLLVVAADSSMYIVPVTSFLQVGQDIGSSQVRSLNPFTHTEAWNRPLPYSSIGIPSLAAAVAQSCPPGSEHHRTTALPASSIQSASPIDVRSPSIEQPGSSRQSTLGSLFGALIPDMLKSSPTQTVLAHAQSTSEPILTSHHHRNRPVAAALDDVTEIKVSSKLHGAPICGSLWWQTFDGESYAIVASCDGMLVLTNLASHSRTSCRFKVALSKIEMVVNARREWKLLLIHTVDGTHYKLLLEHRNRDTGLFDIYPRISSATASSDPVKAAADAARVRSFQPHVCRKFPATASISVQYIRQGPVLSVYDSASWTLEIFDIDAEIDTFQFPLYTHHISPAKQVLLTDRFIFSVRGSSIASNVASDKGHVAVVSNFLSARLAPRIPAAAVNADLKELGYDINSALNHDDSSDDESHDILSAPVVGTPRVAGRPSSRKNLASRLSSVAMQPLERVRAALNERDAAVVQKVELEHVAIRGVIPALAHVRPYGSPDLIAAGLTLFTLPASSSSELGLAVAACSETFLVWTADAIYECKRKPSTPENVFLNLVERNLEDSHALPLAQTLSLDLHSLYEEAADLAFSKQQYHRSLGLYRRSNVRLAKIARKFLQANRLYLVASFLANALGLPPPGSKSEGSSDARRPSSNDADDGDSRHQLVDLLLACYLEMRLRASQPSHHHHKSASTESTNDTASVPAILVDGIPEEEDDGGDDDAFLVGSYRGAGSMSPKPAAPILSITAAAKTGGLSKTQLHFDDLPTASPDKSSLIAAVPIPDGEAEEDRELAAELQRSYRPRPVAKQHQDIEADPSLSVEAIETATRALLDRHAREINISWASGRLLRAGRIEWLLRLAHACDDMEQCLIAVVAHGALRLSDEAVGFLLARGHAPLMLRSEAGRHLWRTGLEPFQQLEVIIVSMLELVPEHLSGSASVGLYHGDLLHLVNNLDETALLRLTRFLDPLNGQLRQMGVKLQTGAASDRALQSWTDDTVALSNPTDSSVALIEVYLFALMQLHALQLETRHKTLNATVPSSVSQLPELERKLFKALAPLVTPALVELLVALRALWGQYRPRSMLWHCLPQSVSDDESQLDLRNHWAAAACVYERGGDAMAAFDSRLRLLNQMMLTLNAHTGRSSMLNHDVRDAVFTLLDSLAQTGTALQIPLQTRALQLVFDFWGRHFPSAFGSLDAELTVRVHDWCIPLSHLLLNQSESPEDNDSIRHLMSPYVTRDSAARLAPASAWSDMESEDVEGVPAWKSALQELNIPSESNTADPLLQGWKPSSKLLLAITQQTLLRVRGMEGQQGAVSVDSSDQRMWSSILANLQKDIESRDTFLSLPAVHTILRTTSAKLRTASATEADGIYFAFTCGHVFARRALFASFVPELESRLIGRLPRPLPVLAKLLVAEYRRAESTELRGRISASCPKCVFNSIHQEQCANLPPVAQKTFARWD